MDWHMYLILFLAVIAFIGIFFFVERVKKRTSDPVSMLNPENVSLYFGTGCLWRSSIENDPFDDMMSDPMYHHFPCNSWHSLDDD